MTKPFRFGVAGGAAAASRPLLLEREITERQRTPASVIEQYLDTVHPWGDLGA